MNGQVTARYLIDLGAESQPRPFPSTVENATAGRNSRDTRRDRLRSAGDASRGIGMRSSEDHDPSVFSVPVCLEVRSYLPYVTARISVMWTIQAFLSNRKSSKTSFSHSTKRHSLILLNTYLTLWRKVRYFLHTLKIKNYTQKIHSICK